MPGLFTAKEEHIGPRNFFKIMVLAFFLSILQCFLAAKFQNGFGPEWMLPLAVFILLKSNLHLAVFGAFTLGLIRDLVAGSILGLWSLILLMIVWLFYPYRSRFNLSNPFILSLLIFMLSVSSYLFVMTPLMAILGWPSDKFNPLPAFFSSAFFTSITSPPLFAVLNSFGEKAQDDD